jgi:site-specific DNA recombinase
MTKAVIYVRVSTLEQVDNYSLDDQEVQCRAYCEQRSLEVVSVFREEGESAKNDDRTKLKEMLALCDKAAKKSDIGFVVVHRLDRFSRNSYYHEAIRIRLARCGVKLRSVTEPIDESATGRYMERTFASIAELDNDLRSERATSGMSGGASRGRWMWQAPIGYLKADKRSLQSMTIDVTSAPMIALAFERIASGASTQAQVLDEMTALGLRTRKGRALSKQKFSKVLRNPIYCGRVVVPKWGIDVRGEFDPIVSTELFAAVQLVLMSRQTAKPSRILDNPEFPLRRVVRCGKCGTPMTASFSTARNRTKHPYYHCRSRGCRGVNIRRDVFHGYFEALLTSHVVRAAVMNLFVAQVEEIWNERTKSAKAIQGQLEARLSDLQAKEDALVAKWTQGGLTDEVFHRQMSRNDVEIRHVSDQMEEAGPRFSIDLDSVLDFARGLLVDLPAIWNRLAAKQKAPFVRALYPTGLTYIDGTIGTTDIPWLLYVIPSAPDDLSALAPPSLLSWNHLDEWLRGVEHLRRIVQASTKSP